MRWLALTIVCLLIGPVSKAQEIQPKTFPVTVQLSWDFPASMDGIVGFKIYRGTSSGSYYQEYSFGITQQAQVSFDWVAGEVEYFVCTAVDNQGLESLPSNEVSWKPYRVLLWWKEAQATVYSAPGPMGPWSLLGTITGTNLWLPKITQEYFKANVRLNIQVK